MTVVQLEEAAVETCGSKSTACRKLLQLAQQSGGSFQAPTGIAFPFGCMDAALKAGLTIIDCTAQSISILLA